MEKKTKEQLILEKMDHVKLRDLKQKIGHDYSKQIQKFIKQKTGDDYTREHIRRCLSMETLKPKFVVFAIELADKLENMVDENELAAQKAVSKFFND
jgi:hypothetical protein